MFYCYILRNIDEKYKKITYNGYTNNPWKRIRQHNGEIKGGAKATVGKGQWEMYVLMTGFKTNNNALSCEWKIKHPTNKRIRPAKYNNPVGRVKSLNEVLPLDMWTQQCTILNNECNYILYITCDMINYLNMSVIPSYIEVIVVPTINEYFCS